MNIRIGHGYDVHRFAEDNGAQPADFLTLGGIQIPHDRRLLAHSDGDVLVHSLCDAILGAQGAGDIGRHFPDSDPQFAGIDSCVLLIRVMALTEANGWRVVNADITVIAEAPKLAPHIGNMREKLAPLLQVQPAAVNIKATTTEKLGFAGRREGIASHAVVLLCRSDSA